MRGQKLKPPVTGTFSRWAMTMTLSLTVSMVVATVARAETLSPWWDLTSGALPTSLQPGTAKSEVQEANITKIHIFGTELAGFELYVAGHDLGEFVSEPFAAEHKLTGATDENLQKALEAPDAYGPGNVVVTGGEIGSKPITVTSTGEDADAKVPPIELKSLDGKSETKVVSAGRGDGQIVLTAQNLGDAEANGEESPIVITDTLPSGLKAAVAVEAFSDGTENGTGGRDLEPIFPTECRRAEASGRVSLTCTYAARLLSERLLEERIAVVDLGAQSGSVNEASVSGGGAAGARSVQRPVSIGGGEPLFGIENYELVAEEADGLPATQAGSHPFQETTTLTFNQNAMQEPAGAMAKDVNFNLPPGLIGNPTPFVQCPTAVFLNASQGGPPCPPETIVGYTATTYRLPMVPEPEVALSPIYNLVPNAGEPARFAFHVAFATVYLDTSVRTGRDYGVTVSVTNISQTAGFLASRVTFWGVPADPRHDGLRKGSSPEAHPTPLLTLPTACTGPIQSSVEADSWLQPGVFLAPVALNEPMAEMDGCNQLPFTPSLSVVPDISDASSASGLTVSVHIPQSATLNPTGLGESTLKDTTVALPEGVAVNPGGADGLEVCSEAQIGYLPGESAPGSLRFTPSESEPFCPNGSKIGTVEVETPLLPNPLKGAVYLGTPSPFEEPNLNPFDTLLSMYVVARDPVSGVLLKLPGKVSLNPTSGRLVATFEDTPPLPFETLRLHFFGGARGPLTTPAKCGTYETQASFSPWSGEAAAQTTSSFQISSGPGGTECHDPLPFSPALTAGTTSIQAGGYSPFTMTMSRPDGSQTLSSIDLHMPDGLSGALQNVSLCPEPQADEGTCGLGSLIGETTVSVGVGGNPFTVSGGKVFITGPYHGAPFGLSIVTPAKAGPFNLGQVVVRAKIEVDPQTAALTIISDPPGTQYSIPTILHGIPLEIQHLNVTINRPEFTFNPTDCEKKQITGTLLSTEDASDQLSVPFQATNCAVLGFKPGFAVSTSGKTSRADGASLDVKLTYPTDVPGYQTNLAKVKVELPRQLPSRLSTLQKACTEKVFAANPDSCPMASRIGEVVATTPILTTGLSGPAYFVSNGGTKFPELIIALKGEDGVEVDLHGETFISKAGITSSTFSTIPDVPVGSFELKLPEGPYSALGATANLCKSKLIMPTEFVAQNGAQIRQNTKIAVAGCPKARKASKKHKHGRQEKK